MMRLARCPLQMLPQAALAGEGLATVLTGEGDGARVLIQMIAQYGRRAEFLITVLALKGETVFMDHFVELDRVRVVLNLGATIGTHPLGLLRPVNASDVNV